MKRWIVLAVVIAIAFAAACRKKEAPVEGTGAGEGAPTEAPASGNKKALPAPVKDRFNVAFVYVGPVGDGGWTWAHDQGRKAMEKALGAHTVFVENVAEGAEAEQVVRSLARKGFDLIIGTSFGYMDAMDAVAKEFPKVRFVHIAGFKSNGTNYGNLFGAMESMKYLAGFIAGARAKADGVPKLGYIAPFPIPEVIRLANAVAIGAQVTCPECTMEIRWLHSWFDPNREREAADSLIKAGAHVVITGADTTGPILAAKEAGKWAVGYDSANACDAAPDRCLTTSYWDWGPIYTNLVRAIQGGTWKGGSEYLDVPSGIVGLSGFTDGGKPAAGVPAEVVPKVSEVLAQMKAGTFTRFDVFKGPLEDNTGRKLLEAGQRLTDKDLEGLEGCSVCMSWLVRGVVGQIPARK
jgi:basic membrane protein A